MGEILRSLRSGVVAGGLAALLVLGAVLLRSAGGHEGDGVHALLFPVPGADRAGLQGSFEEAREGGRRHRAVDIPAPRGASVVAVRAGAIARLGSGGNAGISIDLLDADGGRCYFYAHLEAVRPGLSEGSRVRRGELLGTVGTSGNAPRDAPHLHFAVLVLEPGQSCWDGEPTDPARLLSESAGSD